MGECGSEGARGDETMKIVSAIEDLSAEGLLPVQQELRRLMKLQRSIL